MLLNYLQLFFSVNFSISIFNIPSLAFPVNIMKIAGARFSSEPDVNAFQNLISFYQFIYKESFPRVGGALKSFITLFASAILLPIVINKCHTLYCKQQITGLTFVLPNIHKVFQFNKS